MYPLLMNDLYFAVMNYKLYNNYRVKHKIMINNKNEQKKAHNRDSKACSADKTEKLEKTDYEFFVLKKFSGKFFVKSSG